MFYEYKMSHTFVGKFKGDFFEQQDKARKDFSKKWYNLRSNTSLDRHYRDEWNKAFKAIDELANADQDEQQQVNLIIKEID
tara:strand:- start:54 stop:296 length:243 start_codon:yes stop_codon:yes gene_type:complete